VQDELVEDVVVLAQARQVGVVRDSFYEVGQDRRGAGELVQQSG
jgi:hypothetical protein